PETAASTSRTPSPWWCSRRGVSSRSGEAPELDSGATAEPAAPGERLFTLARTHGARGCRLAHRRGVSRPGEAGRDRRPAYVELGLRARDLGGVRPRALGALSRQAHAFLSAARLAHALVRRHARGARGAAGRGRAGRGDDRGRARGVPWHRPGRNAHP